jgi:hypothetical protein
LRKLYYLAAGLAAVALVAGLAASTRLAPDCKTAWGNQACPPAKSAGVQMAETPTPQSDSQPKPQKIKPGNPKPVAARKTAEPKYRAVPRSAAAGSLGPRPYPDPAQAWRHYRDWLDRYTAESYAHGRYYGAYDSARTEEGPNGPGTPQDESKPNPAPAPDDRARLDPWHGYDSRDGLENGY